MKKPISLSMPNPNDAGRAFQEKEAFPFCLPFRCWEAALPEAPSPPHWHEYHELVHVSAGMMTVTVAGKTMRAEAGDLVIIGSSHVHSFTDASPDARMRIFQFHPDVYTDEDIDSLGRRDIESLFIHAPLSRAHPSNIFEKRALAILDLLWTEYQKRERGWTLAAKALLCQLALFFLREVQPEYTASDEAPAPHNDDASRAFLSDERLKRTLSFIHEHYGEAGLNLDAASRAAALSRFRFSRFFKTHTGRNFHEYLLSLRTARAAEFLFKTDIPITQIAFTTGFSSLATFNRAFKREIGVTPSEYRHNAKLGKI